ncbi:MAG: hypothetical protein HC817_05810 [Saprospiraceae bacterium]|nr:hypothetical protein [Saprospiraceae bacterium]
MKTALCQNQIFAPHFHDTFAVGIIEKGVEILDYDNRQTILPTQTIVGINPFESHSHKGLDDFLWQYSAFYLSEDIFRFLLKKQVVSLKKDFFCHLMALKIPFFFRYKNFV